MRVLIVTDTWAPQLNGVVNTLRSLVQASRALGIDVVVLTPERFRCFGLPGFPDVRLAWATVRSVSKIIEEVSPDHIHLATEGPLGIAARRFCLQRSKPFTTSYHTRFPEYLAARSRIPPRWTYGLLRSFHNAGSGTFASTATLAAELRSRGFQRVMRWSLGVDHLRFNQHHPPVLDLPRPIFLYVGRLAVEKNLPAFLGLPLPGTKVVVGDGPSRMRLESDYPEACFLGTRTGETLAQIYSSADAFVFPSLTDTFGLVLLEAMASGLPIAAFSRSGAEELIGGSGAGVLSSDLHEACLQALSIPRWKPRAHAENFTWTKSAMQFVDNLLHANPGSPAGFSPQAIMETSPLSNPLRSPSGYAASVRRP